MKEGEPIIVWDSNEQDVKSLAGLARAAVQSTIGMWTFSGMKGGRRALRREMRQKQKWFVSFATKTGRSKSEKSARRTWLLAIKKVAGGMRVVCDVAKDQLTLPGLT